MTTNDIYHRAAGFDNNGNRLVAYAGAEDYNDYVFDNRNRLTEIAAPASG